MYRKPAEETTVRADSDNKSLIELKNDLPFGVHIKGYWQHPRPAPQPPSARPRSKQRLSLSESTAHVPKAQHTPRSHQASPWADNFVQGPHTEACDTTIDHVPQSHLSAQTRDMRPIHSSIPRISESKLRKKRPGPDVDAPIEADLKDRHVSREKKQADSLDSGRHIFGDSMVDGYDKSTEPTTYNTTTALTGAGGGFLGRTFGSSSSR